MSTSYYRLKPPITGVRATNTTLRIWINNQEAGELLMRNEEIADMLRVLRQDDAALVVAIMPNGRGFMLRDHTMSIETTLVSESGEIFTLADMGLTPEQLKEYKL